MFSFERSDREALKPNLFVARLQMYLRKRLMIFVSCGPLSADWRLVRMPKLPRKLKASAIPSCVEWGWRSGRRSFWHACAVKGRKSVVSRQLDRSSAIKETGVIHMSHLLQHFLPTTMSSLLFEKDLLITLTTCNANKNLFSGNVAWAHQPCGDYLKDTLDVVQNYSRLFGQPSSGTQYIHWCRASLLLSLSRNVRVHIALRPWVERIRASQQLEIALCTGRFC